MSLNATIVKVGAPVLCAVFLFTLKPFLRVLLPIVKQEYQHKYLIKVESLGRTTDVGGGSLLALIFTIIVFAIVSISTEELIGELSIFVASFCAIGFFYGYFFLIFLLQSRRDVAKQNPEVEQ